MRNKAVYVVLLAFVLAATALIFAQERRDTDHDARQNQPHMQAALEHLRAAQQELQQASSDKGGHKTKAEQLVRQAMTQVEQGERFDNTHESRKEGKREHR
jgi:hypothetical protein